MKTPAPNRTTTLTHFQVQACKLLIDGHDVKSVALQIGKDQTTIRRWILLPDAVEMLNAGKYSSFQEAGLRLAKSSYLASCVLEEVMINPDTKDENRIRAATSILDHALKLSQNINLEQRIHLLEIASSVAVDDDE